jgi:hypothetical protein
MEKNQLAALTLVGAAIMLAGLALISMANMSYVMLGAVLVTIGGIFLAVIAYPLQSKLASGQKRGRPLKALRTSKQRTTSTVWGTRRQWAVFAVAMLVLLGAIVLLLTTSASIEVSAATLYSEFAQDSSAAQAKYQGKTVTVTGEIKTVNVYASILELKAGDSTGKVWILINSADSSKMSLLSTGMQVKIRGQIGATMGNTEVLFLVGTVYMRDGSILEY